MARICIETRKDYLTVEHLTELAFGQPTEVEVVRQVRENASLHPISLVALRDKEIVGHVLFSKISILETKTSDLVFGLGLISVHPDYQQQGIGSSLTREGLAICKSKGALACFVLGATTYYQRFGFQNAYQAGFWYKKDEDNLSFQVISGAMQVCICRTVRYVTPKRFLGLTDIDGCRKNLLESNQQI